MNLPFYYSFREFDENYNRDLNLFISEYSNAQEIDFLKEIKRLYLFRTKIKNGSRIFNNLIWTKEYSYSHHDGFCCDDDEITLDTFSYIVDCNFKHYLPFIGDPFDSFSNIFPFEDGQNNKSIIENPTEHLFLLIEKHRESSGYFITPDDYKPIHKKYFLDKTYHLEYFNFLYYENGNIKADEKKFKDFGFAVFKILDEIDKKIKMFELQKNSIVSSNNENKSEVIEFLNLKQIQKIGLLIQSGIVDFLRSKYPRITNNQIAGFFEVISQEPLKQKSTNTHFTKDKNNSKYPIPNKETEAELNLILSQFGMNNIQIKPSSEK